MNDEQISKLRRSIEEAKKLRETSRRNVAQSTTLIKQSEQLLAEFEELPPQMMGRSKKKSWLSKKQNPRRKNQPRTSQ